MKTNSIEKTPVYTQVTSLDTIVASVLQACSGEDFKDFVRRGLRKAKVGESLEATPAWTMGQIVEGWVFHCQGVQRAACSLIAEQVGWDMAEAHGLETGHRVVSMKSDADSLHPSDVRRFLGIDPK